MGKGEEEKKRKSDNEEISAEGSDFKVYFYCVEISLFRTVKSHLGEGEGGRTHDHAAGPNVNVRVRVCALAAVQGGRGRSRPSPAQ